LVAWGTQDAWALTASPSPQDGNTPLQLAVRNGDAEAAKVLREAGAIE
jgi:ankyrin repeat protein